MRVDASRTGCRRCVRPAAAQRKPPATGHTIGSAAPSVAQRRRRHAFSVSRWRGGRRVQLLYRVAGSAHVLSSSARAIWNRVQKPASRITTRECIELRGWWRLRNRWRGRPRSAAASIEWCARRPAARQPVAARHLFANPRARTRIGWSPPSSVAGSPTTRPSGRHSRIQRSSAGQSGPADARRARPLHARCGDGMPTATPMRRARRRSQARCSLFRRARRCR